MTQLAFICFKVHNRLFDFVKSLDVVVGSTVGLGYARGVALMEATLIAEATALWGGSRIGRLWASTSCAISGASDEQSA
ncbi:hypothetical protein FOA52_012378 [Chlamydomonas sp. UWO 241]|nr:hypothetical protein FOA52_012378 [Chlamydomonas sp. UWO 241]